MENSNILIYLSFTIYNEIFAVSVIKVLEVLQKQKITRVPNAPKHVKGVVNFRGEIIPVFETRTKFGLPERSEDEKNVIIVMQIHSDEEIITIGAIADSVSDVIEIPEDKIKAVPKMGENFNSEVLEGIVEMNGEFILLLDSDKVFTDIEIAQIIDKTPKDDEIEVENTEDLQL